MSVPNVGTPGTGSVWPQPSQDASSVASSTLSTASSALSIIQAAQDSYEKTVAALQSGQATYGPAQAGRGHHHHHHGGGTPAAATTTSSTTDDSTNPLSALGITSTPAAASE